MKSWKNITIGVLIVTSFGFFIFGYIQRIECDLAVKEIIRLKVELEHQKQLLEEERARVMEAERAAFQEAKRAEQNLILAMEQLKRAK